jgi:hypothetical protein
MKVLASVIAVAGSLLIGSPDTFAAYGVVAAAPPRLTAKKSNIVFLLTDDQGL